MLSPFPPRAFPTGSLRYFVILNNLAHKVLRLTHAPEKFLRLGTYPSTAFGHVSAFPAADLLVFSPAIFMVYIISSSIVIQLSLIFNYLLLLRFIQTLIAPLRCINAGENVIDCA